MDLSYDRNSNITWAEDAIHTGFDVKYTLDDLNRLVMAEEGTESSGSIASRTRQELWTLTQTGNWELFKRDINGNNAFNDTGDFNDDRTHNVVNELTARDIDDNGSDNYTLTYDATGNLTDDGESYTYVYDAWYRLRKVKNAATSALIAELTYYGNNHRKGHHYDVDGDGTVEDTSDDPWVYFAWNERWQLLATFTGSTSTPAEEWVIHQAGLDGRGGSSYIDDVILRDRDTDGNGSLDERRYLCQNWRHDLSAIVTDTGKMVEWVKYSSYGEPLALPAGDTDSDGDWDATDSGAIAGGYDVRKDAELDGDVDASDITHANSITGGYQTLGRTVLSSTAVTNRKGYAGYERDHSIPVVYHVRHRVLHTTLGRWTRRDPLGYVDGGNLYWFCLGAPLVYVDPFGLQSAPARVMPRFRLPFRRPGHRYSRPGGGEPRWEPGSPEWWLDQPPVSEWDDWGIIPSRGPSQIPAWNVPGAPVRIPVPRYTPVFSAPLPSPEAFPQPGTEVYESLPKKGIRIDPKRRPPICDEYDRELKEKCHGSRPTSCAKYEVPDVTDDDWCSGFESRYLLGERCCELRRLRWVTLCHDLDQNHAHKIFEFCNGAKHCKDKLDLCRQRLKQPGWIGPVDPHPWGDNFSPVPSTSASMTSFTGL